MEVSRTVTSSVPAPPWRAAPRKARTRRVLSREAVIDAALRVVDTEGLEALSMRRVAQELGTGAASLYAHVAGKEELVEEMLDRVHAEFAAIQPPVSGDPADWQEAVKEWMRRGRAVFASHRDLVRADIARGLPTGPNALVNVESMLALLRGGGLPDKVAAFGVATLGNFLTATVYEESLHATRDAETGRSVQDYYRQLREYLGSLPADRFPNLVGMTDSLAQGESDERFEFGMDLLVSGLAQYAEPAQPAEAARGGRPDAGSGR